MIVFSSLLASLGFIWPFLSLGSARWMLYLSAPLALACIGYELHRKRLSAHDLALLSVLSAVMAALRPLGTGSVGVEPMWFILIIAASVYGARFGFLLGITGVIVSALFTSGIGPWLAYQAFSAAFMGALAGAMGKRLRYFSAILAAFLFGLLMDLQFWPFALGSQTQLSYNPELSLLTNAHRFFIYHFTTSMAWDIPRAVVTVLFIAALGEPLSRALTRAQVRGRFTERAREEKEG